jgi:hypothetical protein
MFGIEIKPIYVEIMKPRIKLNTKTNKYQCSLGYGWLGFGSTPEIAYNHCQRLNSNVDTYDLAA